MARLPQRQVRERPAKRGPRELRLGLDRERTRCILEAEVRTFAPAAGKGAREAVIRVWFVEHPGLGFLVPSRMHGIFAIDSDRGRGEANYSNFRAFGTSARIVPQP